MKDSNEFISRKTGYYYVRNMYGWAIAKWVKEVQQWRVIYHEGHYKDEHFLEINEERIPLFGGYKHSD